MRNYLKTSLTLLALTVAFGVFAQNPNNLNNSSQFVSSTSIKAYPANERISGSPYENADFVKGNIYKDGGLLANGVAVRYNAVRDEIEIKKEVDDHNRTGKVMVKSPDLYVKILNKVFVFVNKKEGIDKPGYFMVLHEGTDYNLYKKVKKEYIEGAESMNSLTRDIPAMYKEHISYYLVEKQSGELKEFPSSKGGKFNVFGNKKKQLKNYAKEEKLNINKEYALVKVVKQFDTM